MRHYTSRGGRSAPASAPADQRAGVRRREMARPAHRRCPRLPRARSTASGTPRWPATRNSRRPRRARLHAGCRLEKYGSSPSMSARSAPGTRRSPGMRTATNGNGPRRIPANSPGRRCAGRGTPARGPRAARTRSPRGRARTSTERWRAELPDLGYRDPDRPVDLTPDAGRRAGPRRGRRAGADSAGRGPVGVERRRRPRRGRAADRRRRRRRRRRRCGSSWPRTSPPAPCDRCVPLLQRDGVPEHIRAWTSRPVLAVEADLTARLAARAAGARHRAPAGRPDAAGRGRGVRRRLDAGQAAAVAALAGDRPLVVIEGAAGAGQDHHPGRHPRRCSRSRGAGWWSSPRR